MPPLTMDDYDKLLQKINVLEIEMQKLKVYTEVNGQYGNETTLPLVHSSGQEHPNAPPTRKTAEERGSCLADNISTGFSPPWNTLGAKPKRKSLPWDLGRITGRTQRPEICDATGWPALSSASTPVQRRALQWIIRNEQQSVQLQNRFAPLLQDSGSQSDDQDDCLDKQQRVRSKEKSRRLQGKPMTGPETVIVGDAAIKDVKQMFSKHTRVLCFPKDSVSDMTERVLSIVKANPTLKHLILHTGACDVAKQQSEILKRDFSNLLNKVSSVKAKVYISGPLPPVKGWMERFSRIYALNSWLSNACAVHSLDFIDNFNFFWDRRHLFKGDGLSLNRSGVKLFASNLSFCLRHTSQSAKDKRQEEPKQQGEEQEHDKESMFLLPDKNRHHEGRQTKEDPPTPTQTSPLLSSSDIPSLPSSPLPFTEQMNKLVTAGLQLTPRPSVFSPTAPAQPSLQPRGLPLEGPPPAPPRLHPYPYRSPDKSRAQSAGFVSN